MSTDRQLGMGGAGPVPWSSVRAWVEDAGLDAGEAMLFRGVVRRLDSEYFEFQLEQSKQRGQRG